jgi:hypothetical protein
MKTKENLREYNKKSVLLVCGVRGSRLEPNPILDDPLKI